MDFVIIISAFDFLSIYKFYNLCLWILRSVCLSVAISWILLSLSLNFIFSLWILPQVSLNVVTSFIEFYRLSLWISPYWNLPLSLSIWPPSLHQPNPTPWWLSTSPWAPQWSHSPGRRPSSATTSSATLAVATTLGPGSSRRPWRDCTASWWTPALATAPRTSGPGWAWCLTTVRSPTSTPGGCGGPRGTRPSSSTWATRCGSGPSTTASTRSAKAGPILQGCCCRRSCDWCQWLHNV